MRRFESGASKRKRAQEEREKVAKLPKLTQFLVPQADVSDTATCIAQYDSLSSCDGSSAASERTSQIEISPSSPLVTLMTESNVSDCNTNSEVANQSATEKSINNHGYDIGKLCKYTGIREGLCCERRHPSTSEIFPT